jgi:hypothetical protein
MERDIDSLYFAYKPAAGHLEGCPRRGTDLWDGPQFIFSLINITLASRNAGIEPGASCSQSRSVPAPDQRKW